MASVATSQQQQETQQTGKVQGFGKSLQDFRTQKYQYQIQHKNEISKSKILTHQIAAMVTTKALILGPLERIKIILQVKRLASFVNPKDNPKNALDLFNKIGNDQGFFAYFRGMNALVYKIMLQQTIKFGLYETVFQSLQSSQDTPFLNNLLAATATGVLTTTVTYPLDFAHGRMAADMSKKPSVFIEKSEQSINNKSRLYSSVRDCLSQAQYERGLSKTSKLMNVFRGYQSALIGQVPYTIVLFSTFEALESIVAQQETQFSKRDGELFLYKMFTRFGPSILSLILAQTLCYPFDTLKRRMQLNGALGHKNLYRNDFDCFKRILKEEGVAKGLYAGFSVNLVRCLPLTIIQYIVFRAYRTLSEKKQIAQRMHRGYIHTPNTNNQQKA